MSGTEKKRGKVWLAGAGPGDAQLLTLKTKALIDSVDVVIYDALVSTEIISQVPKKTTLIDVGKRSGHHPVPQEEINEILLKEAMGGKKVLRLKGEDPLLFGLGGGELECLTEARIPFEVVPGVTSVTAVPAYAGIPVTHQDYTASFYVVTGNLWQQDSSKINYQALVSLDATLVFLMGTEAMEEICQGLQAAGMSGDMPAAILEKGAMSAQRKVISTVSCLCKEAQKAAISDPAIILVGKVCSLGNVFHWAGERILDGRQILIIRPQDKDASLAGRLRELGAQVIELSSAVTRPIEPVSKFRNALASFAAHGDEAWLVFTSPVGVQLFFQQLVQLKLDIRMLLGRRADVKFAVMDSATEQELLKYGIAADVVPAQGSAAELGKKLAEKAKTGSQVLIARSQKGSDQLLSPLLEAHLWGDDMPVYETIYETHEQLREKISEIIYNGDVDAIAFTSASTVRGFVEIMKDFDYHKVQAICIGRQTAAAAEEYHMQTIVAAEESIESVIEIIVEKYGK